jgi:ParB-like chromosome segregation protein Spo0J
MLLSRIKTDPQRFQFRDAPFSEQTVQGIIAEGINLAKFDPIPVLLVSQTYIVAGDGHSRYEAVRRLAAEGRLPRLWMSGAFEWDVPVREVSATEARLLSWTANLSRDDFSPCEEAKVFQAMLESGMSMEVVAQAAHRSSGYVRTALPLNVLCHDIRVMVGKPHDAGGIDKYSAFALAERFQRYQIAQVQQQELWHKCLKLVSLTPKFVRAFLDKIAGSLGSGREAGMLFDLPASMEVAVQDFKDRARQLRRAQLGIEYLMVCVDSGVLDDYPELRDIVKTDGSRILAGIKSRVFDDAAVLGELVTPA